MLMSPAVALILRKCELFFGLLEPAFFLFLADKKHALSVKVVILDFWKQI